MNATTVSTPKSSIRRTTRRLLHRNDNPELVDRHALPSELALRPIEPHYLMRR